MFSLFGELVSARFINRPLFIVGGSRSGTIALLKAMGRHKNILSAPTEDPFITDVGRMAMQLDFFSNEERQYYLRTLRISEDYIIKTLRRLALESAFGPDYGFKQIIKYALNRQAFPWTKRYWCTKTFPGKTVAEGIIRLFPDAKFIWILRNGINVVHSRSQFPEFRELPFEEHCEHWAKSIHRFSYLLELPEATVLKQEEFADTPEIVFRRIFDHIGVEFDNKPVEFALTHHVHPLSDESTTKGVNVKAILAERPPAHRDWDQNKKRAFKKICGDPMQLAGYEIDF